MIRLTDDIWIGDSDAERLPYAMFKRSGIGAILNVAQDLRSTSAWPEIECAHVGLIDGPGNTPAAYCAAVLALSALLERHKVLVCCHTGSRSLAVALIYLIVKRGKTSAHPTFLNHWATWNDMLERLRARLDDLPEVNDCHREAADMLPLALLEQLI